MLMNLWQSWKVLSKDLDRHSVEWILMFCAEVLRSDLMITCKSFSYIPSLDIYYNIFHFYVVYFESFLLKFKQTNAIDAQRKPGQKFIGSSGILKPFRMKFESIV